MLGLGSPISSDTTKGNLYKNGYCLAFDGTNDSVTLFMAQELYLFGSK